MRADVEDLVSAGTIVWHEKLTRSEDHSAQEEACSDLQQVSMRSAKTSGYHEEIRQVKVEIG